jgi:hypothetical protein
MLEKIKNSGLYDKVKEIRCCVLGDIDRDFFTDPKMYIHATSPDISLYEIFTLEKLYEDAKNEDFNVLYIHSKGIRSISQPVTDWVEYLCHFNIYKHEDCIKILENYDSAGVNLQSCKDQNVPIHYSGNFWWSKSSYLIKLSQPVKTCYTSAEFWLTEKRIGKYACLWNSNVNHYNEHYPRELYT